MDERILSTPHAPSTQIADDWVNQRLRQWDYWVVRKEHPLYTDNVVFFFGISNQTNTAHSSHEYTLSSNSNRSELHHPSKKERILSESPFQAPGLFPVVRHSQFEYYCLPQLSVGCMLMQLVSIREKDLDGRRPLLPWYQGVCNVSHYMELAICPTSPI